MKIKRITFLLCLVYACNCFLQEQTNMNFTRSVHFNNSFVDRSKVAYRNILNSFRLKELVSGKDKNIIIIAGAGYTAKFYDFAKNAPDFNLTDFNEAIS